MLVLPPGPPAAGDGPTLYRPPVEAPILDPFRQPAGPYGPGNRGIEYGTERGTPVRASAEGVVGFAGQVGGSLHVTVVHPDGVLTSYSYLASLGVVRGQRVAGGDPVGSSGRRLHFGARRDGAYIDPATLFADAAVVELLPLDEPSAPGAAPPSRAPGPGDALDRPPPGTAGGARTARGPGTGDGPPGPDPATLDWLRAGVDGGAAPGGWAGVGVERPAPRLAAALAERMADPGPCSTGPPPRRPAAGRHRVAVTVGGLGSSSTSGSIDELRTGDLGYRPDRVVRFSYAGGRTPTTGRGLDGLPASDYASADTQGDVAATAARLADLIEQVARADPGAAVDIYGHSLGGVVVRLALNVLAARGFDTARLGVVITLGSPHRGADLASAVAAAAERHLGRAVLGWGERLLATGLDPTAPVVGQLAEGSAVVRGLAADGVPAGVRLVSIAARGDLLVAAPLTRVGGATNVIVPLAGWSAHGDLVASDAATHEMALALAGRPPACESWGDAVADVVVGRAVSAVEDQLGAAASVPPW